MRARRGAVKGNPDEKHISTSFAERQNLTMRMHMRRFTRLTNAFSKKIENHFYAVALHSIYYNFVRIHQTLRVSPAMAAGVTDRLWEIGDIVTVVEQWEQDQSTAGILYQVHINEETHKLFVRMIPRSGQAYRSAVEFETRVAADAWIEQDRKSHLAGRRSKLT